MGAVLRRRDPVQATNHFAHYLAARGLKMTRERRAILEKVLTLRGHFGVEELLAILSRAGLEVSRATLYRALPRLVEAGILHRIEMQSGEARYEPIYGRQHHDHMVCLGCGRIIEFESPEIEKLQERICRSRRFRMTGHTHQVRGYCASCAPKRRRS